MAGYSYFILFYFIAQDMNRWRNLVLCQAMHEGYFAQNVEKFLKKNWEVLNKAFLVFITLLWFLKSAEHWASHTASSCRDCAPHKGKSLLRILMGLCLSLMIWPFSGSQFGLMATFYNLVSFVINNVAYWTVSNLESKLSVWKANKLLQKQQWVIL